MKCSRFAVSTVALGLIIAWLLSGCGGSSGSGTGIQLFIADDPIDAQAVNITISQVAVSKDGQGWTVIRDFGENPVTLNLLDYSYDGNSTTPDEYLLADCPLDEGHYSQIRLILTKIEIVDNNGDTHECEMNSQDITGLKLVGELDVTPGTKSAVLIDFNVAKSIVRMGNGGYRLHPTVRVVPMQITGSLHGVVEFLDFEGATDTVPTGATISAYQGTTLVASALIGEDGSFGMNGLVAGTYTLKLETEGYSAADTDVTVTVSNDTDAGTITAVLLTQ